MAITYEWIIEQLNCYPQKDGLSNVVFDVHWRLNGTDEQYFATLYGSIALKDPGEEFTTYESLTKEQVLQWIWADEVNKDEYEAAIAAQIDRQKNPPVVAPPLPW
jgi:hypothetical protein